MYAISPTKNSSTSCHTVKDISRKFIRQLKYLREYLNYNKYKFAFNTVC